MNRQIQNRLVGTIVLVALAVIFLPDLLDGEKHVVVDEFTEIPLRPSSEMNQQQALQQAEKTIEQFEVIDIASTDLSDQAEDIEMLDDVDLVPLGETNREPAKASQAQSTDETDKQPTKIVEAPKAKAEQPKPKTEKPVAKPTESERKESASQPKKISAGYTLQLGGFNNASNVSALVARLRLSGYTAYTLPEKPVDGKLTRVFVGPEVSEAKLSAKQDAIHKLTGLRGKIIPYTPE